MDFLRGGPIFGLKNREPEPDPGGPRGTPGYPRVCSYVRMSILVPLDRNIVMLHPMMTFTLFMLMTTMLKTMPMILILIKIMINSNNDSYGHNHDDIEYRVVIHISEQVCSCQTR